MSALPVAAQPPASPAPKLCDAASLLLFVAAGVPALARSMGLELVQDGVALRYDRRAFWLEPHPVRPGEITFNADKFAQSLDASGAAERFCKLWLLNVWNPSYARLNGWDFDMITAARVLDGLNLCALGKWFANPIFP